LVAFKPFSVPSIKLVSSFSLSSTTASILVSLTREHLTIIDVNTGKTVSYIQAALYVNAVYSGALQSYSASTAANAGLYDGSTKALITQFATNMAITVSGTTLPSGVSTAISSSAITSASFESLYPSWVAGKTYYYVFALTEPVPVTLTFVGDATATKTASTSSDLWWQFQYQPTFTSLSISWLLTPT